MLKNSPLSSSSRGSLIPLYFAFRVVSSAYLRLLIFFLAILIPPYDSSSPSFCMSFSPYEFNKHRDDIQLYHTPFCFPLLVLILWTESEANRINTQSTFSKCFTYINPRTLKMTLMGSYYSCARFTNGGKGDSEDKCCSVAQSCLTL